MHVIRATHAHLDGLTTLFDLYRVFYKQVSDADAARTFLETRLRQKESCIFVAIAADRAIGFAQLYPSFSSISMQPIWILNDLYVEASHRNQGIATALMETAEHFARDTGAIRVALSTQISNQTARSLYEARGYEQDTEFYHYALRL